MWRTARINIARIWVAGVILTWVTVPPFFWGEPKASVPVAELGHFIVCMTLWPYFVYEASAHSSSSVEPAVFPFRDF